MAKQRTLVTLEEGDKERLSEIAQDVIGEANISLLLRCIAKGQVKLYIPTERDDRLSSLESRVEVIEKHLQL
jgi:hypothetical protein